MWIQTIEIFIVFYNNLGKGITEFRKELNEWNRQMGGKAKKNTSEWMFSLLFYNGIGFTSKKHTEGWSAREF